ncbi:MAG TPA: ADP/ATP-dependent (S)-NAD(P)H-hydrate dehydratase [Naasia sp.]|jgi:hydroxyethylthiazole kinase-like uncharacterized protein yjeF
MARWRDFLEADAAHELRAPGPADDKYSRGVLGMLTGSAEYPGAAVLGVEGAARAGAGMVRYLGDPEAARLVLHRRPEIVTAPGRVQAWLIGSGMDASRRTRETRQRILAALAQELPVVLDAGALDVAGDAAGPTVLTPHAGELATLLTDRGEAVERADVTRDPAEWAGRAAELLGVTVLLKGSVTHVVDPDGNGVRLEAGTPWLATAGSGDVLGGILGAMLAARSDDVVAEPGLLVPVAAAAALIHGRAGTLASGGGPIVALDIAEAVPATIARLLR